MALWLMKCEPSTYSYDDLARDGHTLWDGVANPLALKYLRTCTAGDLAFFYQTGDDKAIVGVMEVTGPAIADPNETDPKLVVVPVQAVRKLANVVTLATIKLDPVFATWELVKQSRLSVMPVSEEFWKRIEGYATGKVTLAQPAPAKQLAKNKPNKRAKEG
jgi:predicted RNA-binding protein with PUA-like domain